MEEPSAQLTRESLRLLESQSSREDDTMIMTPELTSSSNSLSSLSSTGYTSNNNNNNNNNQQQEKELYHHSNDSIATIVQRLKSASNSTVNLSNPYDLADAKQVSSASISTTEDEGEESSATQDAPKPRRLKSSLKLPSLVRSRSMPSTQAKTVRFSEDLTKVKTFNEHAKPSSISLDNTPEQSPPCSHDYFDSLSSPKAFFDLKNNNQYASSSSDSEDEDFEVDYFNHKSKARNPVWRMSPMNFDLLVRNFQRLRVFNSTQTAGDVYACPVKLTSLSINDSCILTGVVEVSNIAFEKYVEIKLTTDHWNSNYLFSATYQRSLTPSKDLFKFEINLNNTILMNSSKMMKKLSTSAIDVELCIKYVAGNSYNNCFYDNNNSNNYKFQLKNEAPKPTRRRRSSSSRSSKDPVMSAKSSIIDGNFAFAKITAPPKVLSSTSSNNGGRYFSEATDYFNTSTNKYKFYQSNSSSSTSGLSSNDSSFLSSARTSSNSSTETLKSPDQDSGSNYTTSARPSPTNSSSTITKNGSTSSSSLSSSSSPQAPSDSNVDYNFASPKSSSSNQSYNDFLQKYCYFKSDDSKNDVNESVFIR